MLLFILNTVSFISVAFVINKYQKATIKLEDAYNMQYKSLILADELRQSSDDLTRMARTYVITGNSMFEEQYKTDVPVIAAGGIYTGADIRKFIELGANGVQMGTRFVATDECDASQIFKDTYINCKKEDIIIIDSPVGLPGRTINNKFLEDMAGCQRRQ